MLDNNKSFGRFAPSPTGELHLGNLRTALLAYHIAKLSGLNFLIRLEDLEPRPNDYGANNLADLKSLGIESDIPVIRQSGRYDIYKTYLRKLQDNDLTYFCFCSRKDVREATQAAHTPPGFYPGTCRELSTTEISIQLGKGKKPAIRLKSPQINYSITDRIHGKISQKLDDIVLMRADGLPAYNLAVVVDDYLQNVSQVARGEDLLYYTPSQEYLSKLFDFPVKEYWHVPLMLNNEGKRLSKRDGAITLKELTALGKNIEDIKRGLLDWVDTFLRNKI